MICNTKKCYLFAGLMVIGSGLFFTGTSRVAMGQGENGGNRQPDRYVVKPVEFVSEEGGFKVKFPVAPTKATRDIGLTPDTQYEANKGDWFYSLIYIDLPSQRKSKLLYDDWRDANLRVPERKLIEEKDFHYDGRLGREILTVERHETVARDVYVISVQRLLLVERRFFRLEVSKRLRFNDSPEPTRSSFLRTANKFLDSFVITKFPRPTVPPEPPVPFPANFGLKIEKDVFSSEYLDFSIDLPADWTVLTTEESELMTAIGAELNEGYLLSLSGNPKTLVMMLKMGEGSLGTFRIGAARSNLPRGFKALSVIKGIEQTSEKLGQKITGWSEAMMIDGVEFARFEVFDMVENYKQRIYVANRKNLALEIVMAFTRDEDAAEMEDALKTLRFK